MPGRGVPRAVVGAVIQAHPAFFHCEGERGGVAHVRHGELDRAVPAGAEHCAFAVHIHNFIAVFTHQMELDAAAPLYRAGIPVAGEALPLLQHHAAGQGRSGGAAGAAGQADQAQQCGDQALAAHIRFTPPMAGLRPFFGPGTYYTGLREKRKGKPLRGLRRRLGLDLEDKGAQSRKNVMAPPAGFDPPRPSYRK